MHTYQTTAWDHRSCPIFDVSVKFISHLMKQAQGAFRWIEFKKASNATRNGGKDTLSVYFFEKALIMENRMEEVKTVARFFYVVHHFLVCRPDWTFWNRWLFHVPQIPESVSEGGW